MVDTFHPLRITHQAAELDDPRYPYSWLPGRRRRRRGPRARASAGRRRSRTRSGPDQGLDGSEAGLQAYHL